MNFAKELEKIILSYNFIKKNNNIYEKKYSSGYTLGIQIENNEAYPVFPEDFRHTEKKIIQNQKNSQNYNEQLVVFRLIDKLLEKGYMPYDIEIEKKWPLGHSSKSGEADVIIYKKSKSKHELNKNVLCIIECKTFDKEFTKEKKNLENDGGQLFSYYQQDRSCEWLILYANNLEYQNEYEQILTIKSTDDKNIIELQKRDSSILLYKNAATSDELFKVWKETYNKEYVGNVLFSSNAYELGIKPLLKKDLTDIPNNNKIINQFEEILRHNNISDKENAFNKLISLFICKIVDESFKAPDDEIEFQYKVSIDTYESLQDRLQRLHQFGMKKFMKEDIFYLPDSYAEDLFKQYKNKRSHLIADLKEKIKFLKFYSNNDFAFKDVHNEELFYQNGKILVEMVQLFENYKIIGTNNLQLLGDLFEQLLDRGFKQSEGQFFTPYPITRFMWKALPLKRYLNELPKIIDYACGAGHFITQGYNSIEELYQQNSKTLPLNWEQDALYGIEKDYRLARVSKISLFMHGANKGNIIFGDGLENYHDKNIINESFDILIANPPYAVSGFKQHLKLLNNSLDILEKISPEGSEIETCFIERIYQLLKPKGICAIILPSSFLSKDGRSFISAREKILENFFIRAIVKLESKTFAATGTTTIILFLEKYNEPPKRVNLILDSVENITQNPKELAGFEDEEIFTSYLEHINVSVQDYISFLSKDNYSKWKSHSYFGMYYKEFQNNKKISNENFYNTYLPLEKEKIKYFGLTYNQQTVIINSPTDNKEQENFLGYSWTNRKGQEGIKIFSDSPSKYCGKLYGIDNIFIADIIQNSFYSIYDDITEECFVSITKDLLSFETASFSKNINLSRKQKIKLKKEHNIYAFNDNNIFNLSIGKRILNKDLSPDGNIPVISANVYKEFGKIKIDNTDENIRNSNKKLIIWGIDGDWLVHEINPNYTFYPTDHCGVLEVKTDNLLPDYVKYALFSIGLEQRFSRSNRASIKRIKELKIQAPNIEKQHNIVTEINQIESKIDKQQKILLSYYNIIINKFSQLLNHTNETVPLGEIAYIEKGENLTREQAVNGNIPVVAGGKYPSCYHNAANREANIITVSASGQNAGYVNFWSTPIFATDCNTISLKNNQEYTIEFIYAALLSKQNELYEFQEGQAQPHVYAEDLIKIQIPKISKSKQNNFVDFFKEHEKEKRNAEKEIAILEKEKIKLIKKYFD